MKSAAAFAAGLWTGAVVVAGVGIFYLRILEFGHHDTVPSGQEKLETRIQLLQQDQARAQAEEARLKQTISELQSKLEARATVDTRRQLRTARREATEIEPPPETWIVDAVVKGDTEALPRLEQAALESNIAAIDALAMLAEHDNGETLTRIWNSDKLTVTARQRATLLLAATAEVNPRAEELLQSIFTTPPADPLLREAALAGILMPDFSTRLRQGDGFPAPPHFRPDYAYRLRLVDGWRGAVTNEQLLALIDHVRDKLAPQ